MARQLANNGKPVTMTAGLFRQLILFEQALQKSFEIAWTLHQWLDIICSTKIPDDFLVYMLTASFPLLECLLKHEVSFHQLTMLLFLYMYPWHTYRLLCFDKNFVWYFEWPLFFWCHILQEWASIIVEGILHWSIPVNANWQCRMLVLYIPITSSIFTNQWYS